jgi:serine/threonine-protein kinase HipA
MRQSGWPIDRASLSPLLYEEQAIGFAPLYDLLCTVAYPQLAPNLAMKIGKAATLEELRASSWTAFAAEIGVGAIHPEARGGTDRRRS